MSPTKKDFEHLVAFLLRQLDPHWRLLGKLEDEVPAMLAWLKYPFQACVVTHGRSASRSRAWMPLMHGWQIMRAATYCLRTPQAATTCPGLTGSLYRALAPLCRLHHLIQPGFSAHTLDQVTGRPAAACRLAS